MIDVNLVVRHPFGIDILEIDSMRVQTVGGLGYVVDGSNINTTFTMMLYYGVLPGLLYLLLQIKACFKMTDWMQTLKGSSSILTMNGSYVL